jgi:hypothetical protein
MEMKLFARIRVVFLSAVFVVMLACSAWADVTSVAQIINDYGLIATVSGNSITITGSINDVDSTLNLGDISGLIINWQATLKANCSTWSGSERILILFTGSAEESSFNIMGGEISLIGESGTDFNENFYAIYAVDAPNVHIFLDGGKITTNTRYARLVVASNEEDGVGAQITLNSGTISTPYCEKGAVETNANRLFVNEEALLNGQLKIDGITIENGTIYKIYGTSILATNVDTEVEKFDLTVTRNATLTIQAPAILGQHASLVIESEGTLIIDSIELSLNAKGSLLHNKKGGTIFNNYGDIRVNGEFINDGEYCEKNNIEQTAVFSKAADPNNGILENKGTISVSSTGRINNNGIINNVDSSSTINNEGLINNAGMINNHGIIINTGEIDNEGTIKSDLANYSGTPPEGNALEVLDIEPFSDVRLQDGDWGKLGNTLEQGTFRPEDIKTFWYDTFTVFEGSEQLATDILERGKNPGLGVRSLHARGITGKDIRVAIIDQALPGGHPEYKDNIVEIYNPSINEETSMHGPAVSSLLVGKNIGTAPGAKLYFANAVGETFVDAGGYAKALKWIISKNKELPADDKIRVISISAAPDKNPAFTTGRDEYRAAVNEARADGILVIDCNANNKDTGLIGPRSLSDVSSPSL